MKKLGTNANKKNVYNNRIVDDDNKNLEEKRKNLYHSL